MLKEYIFRSHYEFYPFKSEIENAEYYVNGHKIDDKSYHTLFDRVKSRMPLDNNTIYLWKNNKTGSTVRSFRWIFNEETYQWEERKQNH